MNIQYAIRTIFSATLGFAFALQVGTGYASDGRDEDLSARSDDEPKKPESSRDEGYYVFTRWDLRKCRFPFCGGVFVKRLNQAWTRCADGSMQRECHAVVTDYSGLGLDSAATEEFRRAFETREAIVRGWLFHDFTPGPDEPEPVSTLRVNAGWLKLETKR